VHRRGRPFRPRASASRRKPDIAPGARGGMRRRELSGAARMEGWPETPHIKSHTKEMTACLARI
ncbi:hypothetical protein, partial [Streptomyces rhizosphaericola]|uniref:hypothetical protein n=1 Tax=Streptomyces rhizosphaericola TaxID=2564098 RepID=UPI003BF5F5E1